jgi:hypothetical protein
MVMNVNSGGPHILLFERDQQLTAILTSEFQLAGFECHAARTAVEVFDTIARHPIRLVLVDLAQAAAGRREFWVALDAQRRGRGVQVFTFRCMNLAGYGSEDPDDRSRSMLADIDVDGMLGVMNLVNAVRSRVSGLSTGTGSFSRIPASPTSNSQNSGAMNKLNRQPEGATSGPKPAPAFAAQVTVPLPSMSPDASPQEYASPSMPARSQTSMASQSSPSSSRSTSSSSHPARPLANGESGKAVNNTPSFTDKIHAVIYPSSRSFSQQPETNWLPHNSQHLASAQGLAGTTDLPPQPRVDQGSADVDGDRSPLFEREVPSQRTMYNNDLASMRVKPVQNRSSAADEMVPAPAQESSLAQLSRMVREHGASDQDEMTVPGMRKAVPPTPTIIQQEQEVQPPSSLSANSTSVVDGMREQTVLPPTEPVSDSLLSNLPLRAAPIQGLTVEQEPEYRSGQIPAQIIQQSKQPDVQLRASPIRSSTAPFTTEQAAVVQEQGASNVVLSALQADRREDEQRREVSPALAKADLPGDGEVERAIARTLIERTQSNVPQTIHQQTATVPNTTSDDMLLNIVQSLPPMSPLPASSSQVQPPVLTGRATRSLGSVLLEGHLVPQHRLEVAQNIQRMLRGVDMNYQLGEILLMFKLLTPDQLLAASLVSYGLISSTQISALGRIRQELHAIGLEYDLESLLVLFRILTPEQLREVRASWTT